MCHLRPDRFKFDLRQRGGSQGMESLLVRITGILSMSVDLLLIFGLECELSEGDGSFQVSPNELYLIRVQLLHRFGL